ncbi:MAG: betaine/proline/choline family ABC transporter ATP-binding protein [Candidatus Bipolaricaulia bacterium]
MIKLQNVTKIYPDGTEAVKDVTLEVGKGELCILLGPSGCGKTTTMKMINRLIPITSGTIYIDGVDSMKLDANELRRNIGYAIQEIGLFPHMTVGQNIETVPALKGWPKSKRRERAMELLELVGMDPTEFMDKYPAELSGGQRQRVGVARALGADPPILLMDEPFGAIDPITREKLQNEFLRIQGEIKKTVVFVTHDINEAIKMGDRIALMKDGQLIQYAPPAALLSQPKNDFVRDFVGADRALKGLRLMRVKEVMRKSPPTVRADDDVVTAKERMDQEGRDWLMVVDDDGKFLGWVSRADLGKGERVRDIMILPVTTATADTILNEALSLMLGSAIGNLAIVDGDGRLEGVLTFNSLRRVLGEIYAEEESE